MPAAIAWHDGVAAAGAAVSMRGAYRALVGLFRRRDKEDAVADLAITYR